MSGCRLCPRNCNTSRKASVESDRGFCRMGENAVVARAGLHEWEEPPISGENGSGAVFFSGCNLGCVFCQNEKISHGGFGKEVTVPELRKLYRRLIGEGAHNINLVTPTHFAPAILESLTPALPVPVVYNCGGYESLETLRRFAGKIQIYLPDFKYADNALALSYAKAPHYFETAEKAILEMYRQVGDYEIDEKGLLTHGVVIRHLVLPGCLDNSKRVIDWVKAHFSPGQVLFSLMSQYTPMPGVTLDSLGRRLNEEEYREITEYLFASGFEDGFLQELSSAKEEYIPPFDLTGIE